MCWQCLFLIYHAMGHITAFVQCSLLKVLGLVICVGHCFMYENRLNPKKSNFIHELVLTKQ